MLGVGFFNWATAFGFQTCLSIFAEKCSRRVRISYLKAIFRQDAQWFDNINYMELASNLSKDASAIQVGCGLKMGALIQAYSTLIGGMIMGFAVGPLYACALLVLVFPFIYVVRMGVRYMGISAML
jgi:ATP-binding cassette subfamily B (MDR/TAP) protein 1